MTDLCNIDGINLKIIQPEIGQGGQGLTHLARHQETGTDLALKVLPTSPETLQHNQALLDLKLWQASPWLIAPFAAMASGQELRHLALFAKGPDLLNAATGSFLEQLEVAFLLACLWTQLERHGVAHGDIAPSNILITPQGHPQLIDFDNAVIERSGITAPMRGQNMMLAPELRSGASPSIASDRFAWAVLFNLWLLRRHPTDGTAKSPAEMSRLMSRGIWPERKRPARPGDVPTSILGQGLAQLFDRSYALNPAKRPTADQWRRGFHTALQQVVNHDCGGSFIADGGQPYCPYCKKPVTTKASPVTLKFHLPDLSQSYSTTLGQGGVAVMGRINLSGPPNMSRCHLSVTRQGNRLLLQHMGQNPTIFVSPNGQQRTIGTIWIDLPVKQPARLLLAGTVLEIRAT